MKHRPVFAQGIEFGLIILLLTACTAPTVSSVPIISIADKATPTQKDLGVKEALETTPGISSTLKSSEVITPKNAHELTQLNYLGRGRISGIAWSPNGRQIAVAASSGIYLVDTTTFDENHFSSSSSTSIAFSPNGTTLASAEGSAVKLWDVVSGKVLLTLKGHTDVVYSADFSPNGKTLASCSQDGTIKLWDVTSGEELSTAQGGGTFVYDVAFSPDGKTLASVAYEKIIKLWAVTAGAELRPISDYTAVGMAFSPAGDIFATADFGEIKLWDINSGQALSTLKGSTDPVGGIAFSPDGKILASGYDTTIKLWDVASSAELRTLKGHEETVISFVFSPDGTKLVSESGTTIKIWDIASGQELRTLNGRNEVSSGEGTGSLEGYEADRVSMAFSPNGEILAAGYDQGPVKLYDAATLKLLAELKTQIGFVNSVAFSPDGKLIAACGGQYGPVEEFGVQIWDVATQEQRLKLDDFSDPVTSVAFSPDGAILATGEGNGYGFKGSVKMWNVSTGKLLDEFGLKNGENPLTFWTVYDVAFNSDGTLLAAGTGNGSVLLWDVANKQQKAVLTGSKGFVMSIAFSPNGNLLATVGSADGNDFTSDLRLWDVVTGKLLFILEGHKSPATSVAFNADGQILASASYDSTVRLWDVETGKTLAILDGINASSVAFSPDGTLLATDGDIVRLWGIIPSNAAQPDVTAELIGGGVTPTPESSVRITPEDLGVEKIPIPILLKGEDFQPGMWSPDGSYLLYSQQGQINEAGPDQAFTTLYFLNARTGETCTSIKETVKFVQSYGALVPEGTGLYERTVWLDDNRLLYFSPSRELLLITPCRDSIDNLSASLPDSILSFNYGTRVGSQILLKGEQAYWLFTPSTRQSVKLDIPAPEDKMDISFSSSPWEPKLVSSRLEERQGELWIVVERIDAATGNASSIYEVQASPDLQSREPMGASIEWVSKEQLLLSDTITGMRLIDINSQPVQFTNLFPDLFGFEFPSMDKVTAWGSMEGTGGKDYHLILATGMAADGQYYIYHSESGIVDQYPLDPPLLVVFPTGEGGTVPSFVNGSQTNNTFRVILVDSNMEPYDLVAKGHIPDQNIWSFATILPGAQKVLFSSIQGISLVDLKSGEILHFWELENQEQYQDFYSILSPDGKTVVGFAQQRDPSVANWTQAMYWLRLEP